MYANSDNFNRASSCSLETGNNVADINNLVNPSAHLTSTSNPNDNLMPVDASLYLNSSSAKVNVTVDNVIYKNK